jgi:hypothetical protein
LGDCLYFTRYDYSGGGFGRLELDGTHPFSINRCGPKLDFNHCEYSVCVAVYARNYPRSNNQRISGQRSSVKIQGTKVTIGQRAQTQWNGCQKSGKELQLNFRGSFLFVLEKLV